MNKLRKKKNKIRLGRGQGSGKGGTCGRGHKGAKSRSGYSRKIGFEGGQMPLHKRIPKFGFRKRSKKIIGINLDTIQKCISKNNLNKDDLICKELLFKKKVINKNIPIKVLGRGKLKIPIRIHAYRFSKKALKIINEIGGKTILK
ncbi:50S ribosomal protein L15 [Blattabacterium cuenoti]|uniref:50S ribosomal protein L15 n=1 Tax=Blattabacterium cuenoti TaxID=1653831 RepID=UPI00374DC702